MTVTNSAIKTYEVADLFCGAGGSSKGARNAIEQKGGRMNLRAINHWNIAIETHSMNHPDALHVVEDVSIVDPESVVECGYLDILMASPECTYHSRARGGKPIHDQGRMNPWAVMNWLTKLDVRNVLIENVPEFVDWGPLGSDKKPVKSHRGEHFQAWFLMFGALGYNAEWRMLNAADYGDATTRRRFFLLAKKDGGLITWPEPSHAKGDTGMFPGRLRWRGAKEIIDWTNSGKSLLDDPKYLKKPLAEKTRLRIARGLERFGGPLAPLYIRLLDLPGLRLEREDGSLDLGFIVNRHGENGHPRVHSVDDPMPTATTSGAGYLVQPDAQPFIQANRNHNAPKSICDPIPTITTAGGGGSFIVEPEVEPFVFGQQSGGAPRSAGDPIPTVATKGAIHLIQPSIIEYYGDIRVHDVDSPITTITQRIKHSLVSPHLIRYNGTSTAHDVEQPLTTVTAQGRKHGLVDPILIQYYGNGESTDVENPVPTITTKDRHGLTEPVLVQVNHGNGPMGDQGNNRRVHSVDNPLPSLTTSPGVGIASPSLLDVNHAGVGDRSHSVDAPLVSLTTKRGIGLSVPAVEPFLTPNFGEAEGQNPRCSSVDDPAPTVTSRGAGNLVCPTVEELKEGGIDPRRLVFLDGHPFLLDIRFRMLQNPELAKAMGFDDDETAYEFVGTVAEVTKQIGNAVPVHMAAALVAAALS